MSHRESSFSATQAKSTPRPIDQPHANASAATAVSFKSASVYRSSSHLRDRSRRLIAHDRSLANFPRNRDLGKFAGPGGRAGPSLPQTRHLGELGIFIRIQKPKSIFRKQQRTVKKTG